MKVEPKSWLPGAVCLTLLTMVLLSVPMTSADPSPGPFIDFKFDQIVEKMPPMIRRLLKPNLRSKFFQDGEQRSNAAVDAEVVVDETVSPTLVAKNDSNNKTEPVNTDGHQDGEKHSDEPVGGGAPPSEQKVAVETNELTEVEDAVEEGSSWTGRLLRQGRQLATNLLSLSNLSAILVPFGVNVDTNNQKVTVDTTALICALIIIFIPIIVGWLIIVYAWIIMSLVEFDYSVYGQFPRPLPTPASSRMDIIQGALKMFRLAYNRYMNEDEDPPVDQVASHPASLPEDDQLREYLRNPDFDPLAPGGKLASQYFDVNDNEIRRRSRF